MNSNARRDQLPAETAPRPRRTLRDAIPRIAREIAALGPGAAAALRRGPGEGAGAAAFWKLRAKYRPEVMEASGEANWEHLLQAIAILTPKGSAELKKSAHDYRISMGEALHAAGLSELRLARLLGTPPDLRGEAVVRICRRLARSEATRFNLTHLALFVFPAYDSRAYRAHCRGGGLDAVNRDAVRRIAGDYYRAADSATRSNSQDTTEGVTT